MMCLGCSSIHHVQTKPSYEQVRLLNIPEVERPYYTALAEAFIKAKAELERGNEQLKSIIKLYGM